MEQRTDSLPASGTPPSRLDQAAAPAGAISPDGCDPDVSGCVAGNDEACVRLLRQHQAALARQVGRFSRDPMVREELLQEVLVEVYFALPRYRPGPAPFDHWLGRIATRVGYRFWKAEARRRRHVPLDGVEVAAAARPVAEPAEAATLLHALLARLRPADRLVLTLIYFEDCSTRQVAQRTGWNRAMVKMRALRARRKLKAIIEREHLLDRF